MIEIEEQINTIICSSKNKTACVTKALSYHSLIHVIALLPRSWRRHLSFNNCVLISATN